MMLSAGSRVGAYEILGSLGAGGMGEVYRARDPKLHRDVALKILPDAFADDPERLARFEREARTLASLNHPQIAQIYGFEQSDTARALVMELVEGEDLAERIARGAIPLDEALPIARQIAEALEAAHDAGIIHRDLKPANIKLRTDGTIKVLDFGLAKAVEGAGGAGGAGRAGGGEVLNSPTITTPAMTMAGVILGTAAYMSPEQAKGKPADKRSDIWAFGCVLYEMLTAARAFEGEDVSDTLASVLKGEPDWSRLPSSTPPLLVEALRGCLRRDRRQRIADASTVRFALDSAASLTRVQHQDVAIVPDVEPLITAAVAVERRRAQRRYILPLAGLSLVFAIAAVASWFRPQAPVAPAPVSRFILNLPADYTIPLTGRRALAISDDGQQIAYVARGSLELRRVADFESRTVLTASGLSTPVFSPDGRTLVFHEAGPNVVKRVATSGGPAVDLCQMPAPFGISWDTSGLLVGMGRQGIGRCSLSGGAPQPVIAARNDEELHGPQMLADRDHLLFTVAKGSDGDLRWEKANVVVESITTHERKVVVAGGSDARLLITGHLVFAREGVVFAVPFDTATLAAIGDPTPVVEGVRRPVAGTTGVAQFAVSPSGTLVYYPGPARVTNATRLLAIGTREGVVTRLPVQGGRYVHTRISPDGKQLAVGSDEGQQSTVSIYSIGGNAAMRRLTLQGRNEFPIWLPNGRHVAFFSDAQGDRGIFQQVADGTAVAERLTTAAADEVHIPETWSPNGQYLVFAVRQANNYTLRVLDRTTRRIERLGTTIESREPLGAVFSPDGNWLAFSRSDTGAMNRGVFVVRFPDGEMYQAPRQAIDFHPTWSPRGDELIFVASAASGRLAVLPVRTRPSFQFGTPNLIGATVTGERVSGMTRTYDVMPDGRFIGVIGLDDAEGAQRLELRVVLNWLEELKQRVPVR